VAVIAVALPVVRFKTRSLRGTPCAKRAGRAGAEAPDLGADQGLRLGKRRLRRPVGGTARRLPIIVSGL